MASCDQTKAGRDSDGKIMMKSLATVSRVVCMKPTSETVRILSDNINDLVPIKLLKVNFGTLTLLLPH